MQGSFSNIRIGGIYSALPANCVINSEIDNCMSKKKINAQVNVTGIQTRHIAKKDDTALKFAIRSAEELISKSGIDKEKIMILNYVTQSPEYVLPSTAFNIGQKLSLDEKCMMFDINMGCTGFVAGFINAASLLQNSPDGSYALVIISDTITKYVDPNDSSSCLIFGDGASAILLEKTKDKKVKYYFSSKPLLCDSIIVEKGTPFKMNGISVLNYVISDVTKHIEIFKNEFDIKEEYIDHYVCHQAQKYILDKLAYFGGIDHKKNLISYDKCGNTSGASIPITICANSEKITSNQNLFMCGFGAGLSMGCIYLKIDSECIYPIEYID